MKIFATPSLHLYVLALTFAAGCLPQECSQGSITENSRLNITMKNASLQSFLDAVQWETRFHCCVEGGCLQGTSPVNLRMNASLKDILDKAFEDQPYDYFISRHSIVIIKKENTLTPQDINEE